MDIQYINSFIPQQTRARLEAAGNVNTLVTGIQSVSQGKLLVGNAIENTNGLFTTLVTTHGIPALRLVEFAPGFAPGGSKKRYLVEYSPTCMDQISWSELIRSDNVQYLIKQLASVRTSITSRLRNRKHDIQHLGLSLADYLSKFSKASVRSIDETVRFSLGKFKAPPAVQNITPDAVQYLYERYTGVSDAPAPVEVAQALSSYEKSYKAYCEGLVVFKDKIREMWGKHKLAIGMLPRRSGGGIAVATFDISDQVSALSMCVDGRYSSTFALVMPTMQFKYYESFHAMEPELKEHVMGKLGFIKMFDKSHHKERFYSNPGPQDPDNIFPYVDDVWEDFGIVAFNRTFGVDEATHWIFIDKE